MIKIENLSKSFGNNHVLKSVNLHLPRYGMVVIQGNSGCGKTTFLNVLSGILPFDGTIQIDGHALNLMSQKEIDDYRIRNYGFVFQDFKLFDNETAINNVMFSLDVLSSSSIEVKRRKCIDLLKTVDLKSNINLRVSNMSGGEKQRVAIARALVNNPKILLCDEPTGSLDSINAISIMDLLKKISYRTLVVVVSHDQDLSEKYADMIIKMEDGQVVDIIHQDTDIKNKYIPFPRLYFSSKRPSLPLSFLFKHTINSLKQKKWRSSICNAITSLGLIGVGLASTLTSSISDNIKKSYSQIIDDTKIVMSLKGNGKSIYGQYSANYFEVSDLYKKYQDDIYDIGCIYDNDFESFFPHTNNLCFADTAYYRVIDGISARDINEFRWLDVDEHPQIYPEEISYLENDQVVLALTINMINDICYELRIERSVSSLSKYLQLNPLKLYFDFRNDNWQYSDQQLIEVVGFTLEKNPGIYHNNHQWNKYMFEDLMRFPSSEVLSSEYDVPWVLRKINYLYVSSDMNSFLTKTRIDPNFDSYVLELANEKYYQHKYIENEQKNTQRLLIFTNFIESIPVSYIHYFDDISSEIQHPLFGTYSGYSIYPSNMMFGFSNFTYFSPNMDSIDETIDLNTNMVLEVNENMKLPDDVLTGHFSQSMLGGVNYDIVPNQLMKGSSPSTLDEIVISSKMEKELYGGDALNQTLYIAYLHTQRTNADGSIYKFFKTTEVTITGVVDEDKNYVYHNPLWLINFFQIKLDVSAFYLLVNSIMIDVGKEKNVEPIMNKLQRAFPEYEITNPMSSISNSVKEVCTYIEIALMCFSIIAVVISILLLSICNYLYVLDNRKEIGLVRCLGVNKKEARNLVFAHSLLSTAISFVLSCVELLIITFLIGFETVKQFGGGTTFSFNIYSILYMFALAFAISIISCLFVIGKINKLNPIEAMKA